MTGRDVDGQGGGRCIEKYKMSRQLKRRIAAANSLVGEASGGEGCGWPGWREMHREIQNGQAAETKNRGS